jgi:hypothetical protein
MPNRAERFFLATAVLLLHLPLWWAWSRNAVPLRGDLPATLSQQPLSVRLLPPDPPPLEEKPLRSANPAARTVAPRTANAASPNTVRPSAITVAPTEAIAAPPPVAAASQPKALDLTLPSAVASPRLPSLRDQGLNDPRSNTPRATVESRIAATSGPDRWEAEPMDDTRTRWRRNGKCIEVHVARNAQIDPFNQSFAPTPKAVKDCE